MPRPASLTASTVLAKALYSPISTLDLRVSSHHSSLLTRDSPLSMAFAVEHILSAAHPVSRKPLRDQLKGRQWHRMLEQGSGCQSSRKCNSCKKFLRNFNYAPLINSIAFNNYKQQSFQLNYFEGISGPSQKWEINPTASRTTGRQPNGLLNRTWIESEQNWIFGNSEFPGALELMMALTLGGNGSAINYS